MKKEKKSERVFITIEQALSVLDIKNEMVHTFRTPIGGMLCGADWELERIKSDLEKYKSTIELAGDQAFALNHGVCFTEPRGPVFLATDRAKLISLGNQSK